MIEVINFPMGRANTLYPTMIVRVLYVRPYKKVVKAKVKVLQSPRQEDRFSSLEIVAFAANQELYNKLANANKGMELIITGKREINTFNNKTIEQIILQELRPTSPSQGSSLEELVSSF